MSKLLGQKLLCHIESLRDSGKTKPVTTMEGDSVVEKDSTEGVIVHSEKSDTAKRPRTDDGRDKGDNEKKSEEEVLREERKKSMYRHERHQARMSINGMKNIQCLSSEFVKCMDTVGMLQDPSLYYPYYTTDGGVLRDARTRSMTQWRLQKKLSRYLKEERNKGSVSIKDIFCSRSYVRRIMAEEPYFTLLFDKVTEKFDEKLGETSKEVKEVYRDRMKKAVSGLGAPSVFDNGMYIVSEISRRLFHHFKVARLFIPEKYEHMFDEKNRNHLWIIRDLHIASIFKVLAEHYSVCADKTLEKYREEYGEKSGKSEHERMSDTRLFRHATFRSVPVFSSMANKVFQAKMKEYKEKGLNALI